MSAKDLVVRPISARTANDLIRRVHYSGKVAPNSQLHIGVYWRGRLEGALQFGPPLDRRKLLHLVADTPWNALLELNRLAFTDALPRNSESRALSVTMRLLKRHAPHVQWVISFSDASQCGDGTIYRAAGFTLTGIKATANLVRRGDGTVIHKMTLESNPTAPRPELGGRSYYDITGGRYNLAAYVRATNGRTLPGYQLRYVYFVDPTARERLTVPPIPYSDIPPDARMYLGQRASEAGDGRTNGTAAVQR